MSDTVIFKNNAIFVKSWNNDSQTYITEPMEEDGISWNYDDCVEFDDDLTIEGFMDALEPYFDIIDEHFASYSRGYKMRHYYDQMKKPGADEIKDDEISHIEFYWSYELQEYTDYTNGKKESNLEVYASFHGKGSDGTNYSFSMSPINNWKQYNFKLNPLINCIKFNRNVNSGLANWITVFESKKQFTLHDVIKYFLYEITFYGYTDTIEQIADKLAEIPDKIISVGMHANDIRKWEIESLKKELKFAEENDDFERAIEIRDRIKELEKRLDDIV